MSLKEPPGAWAARFAASHAAHAPHESLAASEADATLADAYAVQHAFVEALAPGERVAGYKAALTAAQAQTAMGIDHAILGTLYASGDFPVDRTVELKRACILETELGFRAGLAITSPIQPADIPDIIDACLPMIEIASPNLVGRPNGVDLIATNSASYGFIAGTPQRPDWTSVDEHTVRLANASETLHSGSTGEVMGGQREALTWLINGVLEQGYAIEAGHLFMTGAIGGMQPALPGAYTADFGALGELAFSIA